MTRAQLEILSQQCMERNRLQEALFAEAIIALKGIDEAIGELTAALEDE